MPCGPEMVDRIQRAWEAGDAVFPLNQRAPVPEKQRLIHAAQPTRIATVDYETTWDGRGVESRDAVVIATSGTTGEPKCAVLTLDALTASAHATHKRLSVEKDDTWLCCLPPSHIGGFGVIARSLLTSTRLIAVDGFSEKNYDDAARNGATLVSLVATALQRVDPNTYKTILLGGAAPPKKLPHNCITTYGMTETGGGVVYNRMPLDGVQIEIRESIVYVKAPMLMREYRDGTSPITADGWLRTGDIGSLDENGLVQVQGRQGDLIITGGENVWPEAVERVLVDHSAINECCVVGLPDDTWGHVVTAWVVLHPNATISLEEIRQHVKHTLPSYCAPQHVYEIDSIPRTSLGKPQRRLLANGAHRAKQIL